MLTYRRAAENIEIINKLSPAEYPCLYQILNRRQGGLLESLLYGLRKSQKENYLQYGEHGRAWYFQKIERFTIDDEARLVAKTKQTWHTKLLLMVFIGLLNRYKPNNTTQNKFMKNSLIAKQLKQKETGRPVQPISYWSFDKYTKEQLTYCEKNAKKWLDSKATLRNFTKETAISVFGQRRANAVYQDGRKTKAITSMAFTCICEAIESFINTKGYAYRDEVLTLAGRDLFHKMDKKPNIESQKKAFRKASYMVKDEWGKRKQQILSAGGYQYGRPTKVEKAKFGIFGNAWIITPIICIEEASE